MILSEQKTWEEILGSLGEEKNIFLLGCNGCAEASETGGLPQILETKKKLEEAGKRITGFSLIDFLCQKALVKSRLRSKAQAVMEANSLLVMSCGIGVQAVSAVVEKPCHPACNTISLGDTRGEWKGSERCQECGDCLLDYTGGICPLTACTKSLLNGPCGGASKGKCELDRGKDCGWELIYERLKGLNQLDRLKKFIEPKDYGKMRPPIKLMSTSRWALEQTG